MLYTEYCSMIKSSKMRWTGHVALVVERRAAFGVLVGKDERMRTIGKSKLRWEGRHNIKMSVQEW